MEARLPEDTPAGAKTIPRKLAWLERQTRQVEDERVKVGRVGPYRHVTGLGFVSALQRK